MFIEKFCAQFPDELKQMVIPNLQKLFNDVRNANYLSNILPSLRLLNKLTTHPPICRIVRKRHQIFSHTLCSKKTCQICQLKKKTKARINSLLQPKRGLWSLHSNQHFFRGLASDYARSPQHTTSLFPKLAIDEQRAS